MTIIEGIVEHGDARGRTIGFPTANIALRDSGPEDSEVEDSGVEDGVWAAWVRLESGDWTAAAVSVGRRRTFYRGRGPRLLEAHLLDFHGDLYGQVIRVELCARLREQQDFPSPEALVRQLRHDVEAARMRVRGHRPQGPMSSDVGADRRAVA